MWWQRQNTPEARAEELVLKAKKKHQKEVLLDFEGLRKLPDSIYEYTDLTALSVYSNKISSLDPQIGRLTNLHSLHLASDSLSKLPPEITHLTNLRKLSLSRLSTLPSGIGQLIYLKILDLEGSSLTQLPSELGNLINLEALFLSKNHLASLPSAIGNLTKLEKLYLNNNRISSISSQIGKLSNLSLLALGDNNVVVLPEQIGELAQLHTLILRNNKITVLPRGLRKLSNLKFLDLQGNPLLIPPEIVVKISEPKAILAAYFGSWSINEIGDETSESSVRAIKHLPLHEAKTLLVGQGSVGKTSLVQQILHGRFDQNVNKTEGISINQWRVEYELKTVDGESPATVNTPSSIKLNIWDFGGQEILHATHQFFLTKRSLYLLVLDARMTQEENRVEYWLKIIQSFGGESPVLIVGNKTDQHPLDIDRTGLRKKYPNIVGILETSAATGTGIGALKTEIAKQVDNLPHIRDQLPETWFTVKSKLEELGRDKNFITQDEYFELCATNEISDETSQRALIGFLHDLGVVLHFQDDPRLEALGILNPQWVTNGVYKILNSHKLFQNQGTLTLPILSKILDLPEYPNITKRLYIIDMMKKFELCYDIEPDKSFLIPDLLPKDEPFTGEWNEALAFQYQYNVLPSSIITRFIVRMKAFIYKTAWRSGVVLKSGGNTAMVKADTEDRKIFIWVTGDENTRRDFLSAIRMEFDAIHKTIAKIEATEKVPLLNYPGANPVDYRLLLQLEQNGISTYHVQAGSELVEVNVQELLDGVRPAKNQALKAFISYAHKDRIFAQKLAGELQTESMKVWWDFDSLKGGQDWQKEIERGIKQCDFFLVILTPDAVASDWVGNEITYATLARKRIIPLYLTKCDIPIGLIKKQFIDFEKQTQKAALIELKELLKTVLK